jgi:hypothetical protein
VFPPLEVLAETPDTIHLPPGTEQEQTDNIIRSRPGDAAMNKKKMAKRAQKTYNQFLFNEQGKILEEILDIRKILKNHGEAHMAQDILPQFTKLCEKVESVRDRMDVIESQGPHTCHNHAALGEDRKRIIDLESRMNCGNHPDIITRIRDLERAKEDDVFPARGRLQLVAEKIDDIEAAVNTHLKSVADVEILKTQMAGLESDNAKLWAAVGTLEIQMQNLLPVHNNMMDEVLKQKAFLAKVQALLDRERDARLVNSPSHKKELEALKMDREIDTKVKPGRPRKP